MQLLTKDHLVFRRHLSKAGAVGDPVPRRAGHQVKLEGGYRQTIKYALPILAQVQALQKDATQQIDGLRQVASPPVKPTVLREVEKQRQIRLPIIVQLCFLLPATTLTKQCNGDELAVTTRWLGTRAREVRGDFLPDVIHDHVDVQAKNLKIVYHSII
jgi:hypothetical protein